MRLPAALDHDQFPEAERSVLLLDGDCTPLGLTVVPIDEPHSPVVRAASLSSAVRRYDLVVELTAAAWVHGALPSLPRPVSLAVDRAAGTRTRTLVPPPREVGFRRDDLQRLGGVLVTTPLKTAFDLLRLEATPSGRTEETARDLLRRAGLSPAEAAAMAREQTSCPNKRRGIERLAALAAP